MLFVTPTSHTYLQNHEEREEGGTPDIVGAIRAGLVMQLKEAVGSDIIYRTELKHARMIKAALDSHPLIHILGKSSEGEEIHILSRYIFYYIILFNFIFLYLWSFCVL